MHANNRPSEAARLWRWHLLFAWAEAETARTGEALAAFWGYAHRADYDAAEQVLLRVSGTVPSLRRRGTPQGTPEYR